MAKPVHFTPAEQAQIADAVHAAEAHTAGEIITVVADQSDTYADVALLWSAFVALLALVVMATFTPFYLGLIDRIFGSWNPIWTPQQVLTLAAFVASIKFVAMWLVQLWRPLRLLLVPGAVKHTRVHARAQATFHLCAEARTSAATGVLIYVSRAERRAEIIADRSIAAKVAPEVWGEAMHALLSHTSDGRLAEGMVQAVGKVGAVLAEHFPLDADDKNELPDRPIEI